MKLNKKAKVIIFIIFIAVFFYLNYSFIYEPRNNRIQQLDEQISTLHTKIEEGRRIAARLNDLKREYAELTERLKFVEVLLPKEKDIPDFLVLLQETMDEFNIDFTNFSPQNIVQEKDAIYARLPINMTFTANYFETIKFLDRLENFPRIVDIRDLELNPTGDNAENVNVSMTMFTYVLMKGN
ncbi:MAG: type 4a pilus biogenesis protein PilO [Candidatus Caldatribacteriota bacterium]